MARSNSRFRTSSSFGRTPEVVPVAEENSGSESNSFVEKIVPVVEEVEPVAVEAEQVGPVVEIVSHIPVEITTNVQPATIDAEQAERRRRHLLGYH